MGTIIKKILNGTSRIIDISGSITSKRINRIYEKNVKYGFKTDRKNISSDFRNATSKAFSDFKKPIIKISK